MSKFTQFIKNYVSGGFSPYSLISAVMGKKPFGNGSAVNSLWNKYTSSGLTGAEQEANAFTAEQAQKQMDFQKQMRDSQYQSAVTDMANAGLNPALLYGSGASGNASPSGSMASSVAPGTSDPVGLLKQIADLSLLNSQRKNINADTDLKKQEAAESAERSKKIREEVKSTLKSVEVMDANIRKTSLESDSLEIANRYLEAEKDLGIAISGMTVEEIGLRLDELGAKIELLKTQDKATLQSIVESRARAKQLLSSAALNDEQAREAVALTKKANQETENLVKSSNLTQKDIEFYEWNHGSEMSGFGLRPGIRYVPNQKRRDKNR